MSENTDICRIQRGDQEFILVGTAHISKESRYLVAQAIEEEHPDTVCV